MIVKQLKASKQRQITIPAELKEHGFEFKKQSVMKWFINEKGNLEIEPPSDPLEELAGLFAGAKQNPAFDGLSEREAMNLVKKMEYENKDIRHQ